MNSKEEKKSLIKPINKSSQEVFLALGKCHERLLHGSRGFGKSFVCLMDYLKNVGRGWGSDYKGVVIRRKADELRNLKNEFEKFYRHLYPWRSSVGWNDNVGRYVFPTGEKLFFVHASDLKIAIGKFQGDNICWMLLDELPQWKDPSVLETAKTALRSNIKGYYPRLIASANPFDEGRNWVKDRYIYALGGENKVKVINKKLRANIKGHTTENIHMHEDYFNTLMEISDPDQREAFLLGSWDSSFNTAFSGSFKRKHNLLPKFKQDHKQFKGLDIRRSFDWGFEAPFSLGWCMLMDGRQIECVDGSIYQSVRGDIVRVHEYYGADKKRGQNKGLRISNEEIASIIKECEIGLEEYFGLDIYGGGCDISIFSQNRGARDTASISQQFEAHGIYFDESLVKENQTGRINGLSIMRDRFKNAWHFEGSLREKPALFILDHCSEAIKQIGEIPKDEKKIEDVATDSEDHCYDEFRYATVFLHNYQPSALILKK